MFGLDAVEGLVVVLWLAGVVAAVRLVRRGVLARGLIALVVAFFVPVVGGLVALLLAFLEWRSRSGIPVARETSG